MRAGRVQQPKVAIWRLRRRVGEELLDHQFAYAKRHELPFALLFIDLDCFKSINDQFGHEAGDDVLSNAGRNFTLILRRQDVVIRWGGEEFVIGLPGIDAVDSIVRRLAVLGLGQRPDGGPRLWRITPAIYASARALQVRLRASDQGVDFADIGDLLKGRNCGLAGPDAERAVVLKKAQFRTEAQ